MFDIRKLRKASQRVVDKPLIMLVDDEEQNLNVLQGVLGAKYEIISCLSGAEALEKIKAMDDPTKLKVIISDQRMPNMTGVQFFERVIDITPETIRIILTGYTDVKAIIDTINKASIYKFITKPFQPPELMMTVMRAVELYDMQKKLKEGEKLKREFIGTISHELRTPMNGIQGGIELMKMDKLKENYIENLKTIEDSAQHMMGLVGGILDFAIFESGVITLQPKASDLKTELAIVIDDWREKCEQKKLTFSQDFSGVDKTLDVDVEKLKQVVGHLLSNAFKFTSAGKVSISAKLDQEDDKHILNFCIEDTGIGIEEALQAEVFKLFKQADGTFCRKYGGLGIGLTLTKRLVEILEGKIELESEPNKGTVVRVKLPVKIANKAPGVTEGSGGAAPTAKQAPVTGKPKILVVEDNEVNQRVLKGMLERLGCEVETCDNGQEALDWCDQSRADLIFMDCQMPVMDGIEAAQKIRAGESQNKDRPIIAVTANVSDVDKEKCLGAGMNRFLGKPIKKSVIVDTLLQFIDLDIKDQG